MQRTGSRAAKNFAAKIESLALLLILRTPLSMLDQSSSPAKSSINKMEVNFFYYWIQDVFLPPAPTGLVLREKHISNLDFGAILICNL